MQCVQTKLTCISCKQKLHINIKARLLPCLQALCQSCVDIQHGQFPCGYCRNVHMVDNNLPHDTVRRNMVTLVEPEQGYTCTNAPDGNLAESFCTDHECQVYLCRTCLKKHESLKMSQNHTLLAVSEMTSMPVYSWKTREMCLRHPQEQLRLYDEGCRMPICFLCRHTDHDGHSCSEIERVYKRESANLQEKADDLQTKLKTLDEHVEKGKDNADAIALSRVHILEEIKQSFEILYECLKQREVNLIQETQQHFTKSVAKNDIFLETLATKGNTVQSTVSYFKDSMKFAAYCEWLSLKQLLQDQINLDLDDTIPDLDESSWRIVYVSKGTEDLQKRIKKFGILTDTALTTSEEDIESDTLDQLKAEDVRNKAHIEELQNRIQSLESKKDFRVELEDLENKLVSEQMRVSDIKASKKQDEDKLLEMTSENTHLQEENQRLLKELTDAKNKFEEISVQYQQALSDKDRMREETENIKRDHLQLEESLSQLQKRYEILEEVKTTSERDSQILETKSNKLQQKLYKTDEQIDEMKHQHKNELLERERQRKETEDKFNQSQNKCIQLQESLDELQKRYSKLEEEKTSSTKQRQILETKMNKLQQKLESEQDKTQKLYETDEQIDKMKLRHQNELLERERQREEAEDKFNQCQNKCIQLQESLDELQKRYSKVEEEKTSSNKQRQILETKMNKLQQKLESEKEKTQKLCETDEQIDKMKLRHQNELLERERQRGETEDKFNRSQNKCIQLQESLDELQKRYSKLEKEKTSSNKERQILETKMNKLQQKLESEKEKTKKLCKTVEQTDEMKHQHQNELLARERQMKETEEKFSQSQKKCTELQGLLDASVVNLEPEPDVLKAIARPEMGFDPASLNRRYVHIKDGYLVNAQTALKTGDLWGKSMHRGAQSKNPIPYKGSVYWETNTIARLNETVSGMEPFSEVVVAQKDSSDVCQQLSGQKRTASFLVIVCNEHKSVCGILMTEDKETVHTQIIPFQDLSPVSPVTFTNGFLYSRDDNKLVVCDVGKKIVIGCSGKLPALITPVVNVGVFFKGKGEVKVKIVSGDEISWNRDKTCLLEKALAVML